MSNDGGPAFPLHTPQWHETLSNRGYPSDGCDFTMGMTLRDYFAAKAMQAILAGPNSESAEPFLVASWAYRHADAMIEERQ